ncbi:MAG: sodium/glutamate symporter [Candidatus Neomarinimicrobiota bacterium]
MFELDSRQTLIVAILVLFLGKKLNKEVKFLREYNIPEPVTGGVIASLVFGFIYFFAETEIIFALTDRDTLLLIFFTTIGLSSRISTLIEGGKSLLILLVCAVAYLFLQNFTGIAVTTLTGLNQVIGVIGGSVSLSGGHGTAIAWSEIFTNEYGISNASEIGIACATFGLILGGLIGGPIAKFLINRNNLKPASSEEPTVGIKHEKVRLSVDYFGVLNSFLVIAIAMGFGIELNELVNYFGLQLPTFVTCLFAGIILTNSIPFIFKNIKWPTNTPSLALISDLSLGLFLAMSLMSLQLWTLIDLAGPIIILLACQVVVIVLFVTLIVFRLMGGDYDAAVISSGYAGLGLGATPTAIANMTAVTKKFGASPKAFIVVPLVGAFFVDISNAFIIKFLLSLIS